MTSPSYCSRCGGSLAPGAGFCSACGTPVASPSATSPTSVPAAAGTASAGTAPASRVASSVPVKMPAWLDLGLLVTGIGALLAFIGFLFGSAAVGQTGTGGSFATYQGDLETFFVLTGFGLLLIVGGWIFRVVDATRKSMRKAAGP